MWKLTYTIKSGALVMSFNMAPSYNQPACPLRWKYWSETRKSKSENLYKRHPRQSRVVHTSSTSMYLYAGSVHNTLVSSTLACNRPVILASKHTNWLLFKQERVVYPTDTRSCCYNDAVRSSGALFSNWGWVKKGGGLASISLKYGSSWWTRRSFSWWEKMPSSWWTRSPSSWWISTRSSCSSVKLERGERSTPY